MGVTMPVDPGVGSSGWCLDNRLPTGRVTNEIVGRARSSPGIRTSFRGADECRRRGWSMSVGVIVDKE